MENPHQPHRVVIVGAGFGGLRVASALKGAPVHVTIIDRANHHLFQPLLYQVATATMTATEIAVPVRSMFRGQENVDVVMGHVERIDHATQCVSLADGSSIPYDSLVVAAGARTHHFGHDKWAEHSVGLKTVADALALRQQLLLALEAAEREDDAATRREMLTFAVVGGGPTGVEMSGAIAELCRDVLARDFRRVQPDDIRVVLIEMADRLLLPFDPSLSHYTADRLKKYGVEVRLNAKVVDIDADGVTLEDERVPASLVCWSAGVSPCRMEGLPTQKSGHVRVEQDCSVPQHPNVFVIGDMAQFIPEGKDKPLPGLAPVAIQQGAYVGGVIRKRLQNKPVKPFSYLDKGMMATLGPSRAVLEFGKIRMAGILAWYAWVAVHVYYLIGFRNRMLVLFEWFWSYISARRGARLISHGPEQVRRRPSQVALDGTESTPPVNKSDDDVGPERGHIPSSSSAQASNQAIH